jgi:hypothetical protein
MTDKEMQDKFLKDKGATKCETETGNYLEGLFTGRGRNSSIDNNISRFKSIEKDGSVSKKNKIDFDAIRTIRKYNLKEDDELIGRSFTFYDGVQKIKVKVMYKKMLRRKNICTRYICSNGKEYTKSGLIKQIYGHGVTVEQYNNNRMILEHYN